MNDGRYNRGDLTTMDVTAGTRLGPYEIVAPLGAGGMGQVYRARDTRLKRDVALKVISQRMQAHPDLRDRFQREATAVAALNHPNICQVYDVGAENGVEFIVMELVDGDTLAARLSRGPLPIAEAVRVARELTAAVGAAHRAGLIHRDIKPSNIMLTRSGLKLLDFGLARQQRTAAPAERPADWTPDGATLIYTRDRQIWSVTPGRTPPAPLLPTTFNNEWPRLSPDGRLLTYTANDTGANQIYVSSLTGERGRVQISVQGDAAGSAWSRDGRHVYFRGPTGAPNVFGIFAAEITTVPRLSATKPRLLFINNRFSGRFDLSPDGKRFAMVALDTAPPRHTLHLVQNWRSLSPTNRD